MEYDLILGVGAIVAIACAVVLGPTRLLVRATLRRTLGPQGVRRWQTAATIGLQAGTVGGVLAAYAVFGGQGAFWAAIVSLLLLLGALDLAWRWLPFVWTVPFGVLGLGHAIASNEVYQAFAGAMAGAGFLFGLQITFRVLRGVQAVGTGDIVLIGAMGTITGPMGAILVLGIGATTALIMESLQLYMAKSGMRPRLGVAYGAHLSAAFLFFLLF